MRGASDFEPAMVQEKPSSEGIITTRFVADSQQTTSDMSRTKSNDFAVEQSHQTIADFLNKPFLVTSVAWGIGNPQNSVLWTAAVSAIIASNTAWTNKISGFQMYRGTAVITLVLNANPFQSGKVLLRFLPNFASRTVETSFAPMHNTLISSKRMQPCVEVDCRDSGAVFKIPYIAPTDYASTLNAINCDWGNFFLDVLAPLRSGALGETEANLLVYLHFEDFELAAPLVPQSGQAKKRYTAKVISNSEQSQLSTGAISKGLDLAAKISEAVSSIPILAPITTPAAWVFRGLAGLASHFGWSKAQIEDIPVNAARQAQRYAATSDGSDTAYPLALITGNQITVSQAYALTDQDEMSFEYLKRIATVTDTRTWTTANAPAFSIYSKVIAPHLLFEQATRSISTFTATYGVGPPVYYLSQLFGFYRGGIKLTIKIAKCDFHSGRLQVTFTPSSAVTPTAPTIFTSTLALREIIDIRCGSEFTLILPYLLPNRYAVTNPSAQAEAIGTLNVVVLNELRAPETASQTVDLLFYYSAADDFEFQQPINGNNRPLPFSPQMDCKELVNEPIGNSKSHDLTFQNSQMCFGEHFSSVKQLLSRNSTLQRTLFTSGNGGATMSLYPWAFGFVFMTAGTGVLNTPAVGGDIASYLIGMYAYQRGGVRLVLTYANTGVVTTGLVHANVGSTLTQDLGTFALYNSALSNWGLTASVPTAYNGCVQTDNNVGVLGVNIPYYSGMPVSFAAYTNATNIARANTFTPAVSVAFVGAAGSFGTNGLSRSFRDDYHLHYFIGCPPVLISYV